MKRTSRSRRAGVLPLAAGWYAWAAAACALAAILFWRTALSGLLWRAVAPIAKFRAAADSSQVSELQAELASTTAALADRDLLYQENADLKALLGRSGSQPMVLAGVILRPPATPYDTLTIDAGAQQGVVAGDRVVAGGESLIGTVAQAYPTTARVVLFSAPGQSLSALLTSGAGAAIPITVAGQGNGSMFASVPAGTPASVGESVVFPGVSGGLLAKVSGVVSKEGDSFETLYLHLPADPLSLRFVEVLK